jgi:prepilin-type N-terminal cleavage/methylation domain-containing protein
MSCACIYNTWDRQNLSKTNMLACGKQIVNRKTHRSGAAFTLIELVISIAILAMVMAGMIFGYAQANRFAEWSSMSLAAQSYALQGLEQVRSAKWDVSHNPVIDYIPAPTNYTQSDTMDIPVSGAPYYVTNYIKLIQLSTSPQLREVWSQCVWVFPRTGKLYTNTVVTYRAPDQQ